MFERGLSHMTPSVESHFVLAHEKIIDCYVNFGIIGIPQSNRSGRSQMYQAKIDGEQVCGVFRLLNVGKAIPIDILILRVVDTIAIHVRIEVILNPVSIKILKKIRQENRESLLHRCVVFVSGHHPNGVAR